jgi:hypothetical protein
MIHIPIKSINNATNILPRFGVSRLAKWRKFIEKIHEEIGHFGEVQTLAKVRKQFFWHDRIEYVRRFVKICEKCELAKEFGNMKSNIEKMKSIMICDFFYCVALDITKPLLEMKDGNK